MVSRGVSTIALAAIVFLGAALRLWGLGHQPLWTDEALTAVIAQAPPLALAKYPIDPSGPFYYWLHQWFVPVDASPAQMRAISVICGILLIPMTYTLGRQLLERKSALLSAALVSLSFPLIDYSREARAYSLLALLFCLIAWLAIRAAGEERTPRRRTLLLAFCIASAVALYTHFIAFVFVASVMMVFPYLVAHPASALRRGEAYLTIGAVGILAAPEAWRIVTYAKVGSGFNWLKQPSFSDFLSLLAREWPPGATMSSWGIVLLAFTVAGVLAARRPFASRWRAKPAAMAVLFVWLAQPFLLWIFGLLFTPVLMQRTMLPAWPAFALVLAIALSAFRARAWLLASGAALFLYAATLGWTGQSRPREAWDGTAAEIRRIKPDAVIICAFWKAPAALSALRDSGIPVIVRRHGDWRVVGGDSSAPWARRYADAFWFRETAHWLGPAESQERVALGLNTVALISSECDDATVGSTLASMGGKVASTWHSGDTAADHRGSTQPAPITVETVALEQVKIIAERPRN